MSCRASQTRHRSVCVAINGLIALHLGSCVLDELYDMTLLHVYDLYEYHFLFDWSL